VALKGKQSLLEDGIVLPKHVGATVKENKEVYNFSVFSWLISMRSGMSQCVNQYTASDVLQRHDIT
jgi:hypothetical protein